MERRARCGWSYRNEGLQWGMKGATAEQGYRTGSSEGWQAQETKEVVGPVLQTHERLLTALLCVWGRSRGG